MIDDPGWRWEAIASEFATARSNIGSEVARRWAISLQPGGEVVDIGCGSGVPISVALADEGLTVFGIDASPTLLSMFRSRLPHAPAACEAVQDSTFFGRQFDGAIAVGLMFLLQEAEQQALIERVSRTLRPGARFLFSAPRIACAWHDVQTGQASRSLGEARYRHLLRDAQMRVENLYVDDGGNDYFDAVKE